MDEAVEKAHELLDLLEDLSEEDRLEVLDILVGEICFECGRMVLGVCHCTRDE